MLIAQDTVLYFTEIIAIMKPKKSPKKIKKS